MLSNGFTVAMLRLVDDAFWSAPLTQVLPIFPQCFCASVQMSNHYTRMHKWNIKKQEQENMTAKWPVASIQRNHQTTPGFQISLKLLVGQITDDALCWVPSYSKQQFSLL